MDQKHGDHKFFGHPGLSPDWDFCSAPATHSFDPRSDEQFQRQPYKTNLGSSDFACPGFRSPALFFHRHAAARARRIGGASLLRTSICPTHNLSGHNQQSFTGRIVLLLYEKFALDLAHCACIF
mgnify:CR=1 FL=1